ncbi:MAG: potassium channel family protein [Anaerolineaceae bacterium]|nr:MAG: potassium channel family protein [Anaerolineaceae bacterium]
MGRLARIIRFLRAKDSKEIWTDLQANRAQSALLVTAFVAIVLMSITSVVVLQAETRSVDANIATGGDAFWWAFVTVTTVGYGDHYPVTGLGRLMAMILMVVGVGIFGVLTSYLSATFLGTTDTEADTYMETVQLEADMAHLKKEMVAIKEMLQELKE